MRACPRRAAAPGPRHRQDTGSRADDGGFTLIEVLVSLALVGMVAAAIATSFVAMTSATNVQGGKQSAVQLASSSIEQARALKATAVIAGRDEQSTKAQWTAGQASPTVARYLSDMTWAWDPDAAYPSGATAALPT